MRTLLPIRDHFFRVTARVGIGATLIASLSMLSAAFILIRKDAIESIEHAVRHAVSAYQLAYEYEDYVPFGDYLKDFAQHSEFNLVCAYDADNHLQAKWRKENFEGNCPPLMVESGRQTGMFSAQMAEPIESHGHYIGMIYAEGNLAELKLTSFCALLMMTCLLLICWLACRMTAAASAKSVTAQLAGIRAQIECLKDNDISFCAFPPAVTMAEMADLSAELSSLREHIDTIKVPKSDVVNVKRWYWNVLSGMLAGLRHRLDAHSPLLENVSDYALFMQTERGDLLPPPRLFNIDHVLDATISSVRKNNPVSTPVNLTLSLEPGTRKEWIGHPEILGAMLRHMLLIGLDRTRSGFVCLRVNATSEQRLHIAYEDSGPPIQRWQLMHWLASARQDTPPVGMAENISWLLVSRLCRRLGGDLVGVSKEDGGLTMEGSLPMAASSESLTEPLPLLRPVRSVAPLVLLVQKEESSGQIAGLLADANCRVFTVTSHAEALEWAAVLPFSVIIVNTAMQSSSEDATRRLQYMKEGGALPDTPCWAITDRHSFIEADYWRARGISELLLLPLSAPEVRRLCLGLQPPDNGFFHKCDERLRLDFTASIAESLPHMNQMLAGMISQITLMLGQLAEGMIPLDARHQVHAVRSVALNLGYFRLAGLMGLVEHHIMADPLASGRWAIIIRSLRESLTGEWAVEPPVKTPPSVPPPSYNAPRDHGAQPAG